VNESLSSVANNKDILIVTDFVYVQPILKFVDVLICHGGQLSIQCGLAAGLPIVGVPSQAEQFFNLQNIETCNAGVCILPVYWEEDRIREALLCAGKGSSYKIGALELQREFFQNGNAAEKIATLVWNTLAG
jgi:UDP:flavonoid glycosyltransferase YjiC (YdhE family)